MARGNAVLKAKRVTGPSANTQLRVAVAQERCRTRGCANPVVTTVNLPEAVKRRYCVEHIPATLRGEGSESILARVRAAIAQERALYGG